MARKAMFKAGIWAVYTASDLCYALAGDDAPLHVALNTVKKRRLSLSALARCYGIDRQYVRYRTDFSDD